MLIDLRRLASLYFFNIHKYQNSKRFQSILFFVFLISILAPVNSIDAATFIEDASNVTVRPTSSRDIGKDLVRTKARIISPASRRGVPWLLKAAGIAVATIAATQRPDINSHGLITLPNLGFPGAYATEVAVGAGEATATASPFVQNSHIATWVDITGETKEAISLEALPSAGSGEFLGSDEHISMPIQSSSFNLFQQIVTNGNRTSLAALEAAAVAGDPLALGYLSAVYSNRNPISNDDYKAELYAGKSMVQLKEIATQGNAEAQWLLGKMYAKGLGTAVDKAEASKWIHASAMQAYAPALEDLAIAKLGYWQAFTNLSNSEEDKAEGVTLCERAAKLGYASAQGTLGLIYRDGNGVEKDKVQAIEWLTRAAEQNETDSLCYLALMHDKDGDYTRAMEWYKRAAEQGNSHARYRIGDMYQEGKGVPKDDKEALKWFIWAEEVEEGQKAVIYKDPIEGMAIKGNLDALDWIKSRAEKGDKRRQYLLGLTHLGGKVLPQNKMEGIRWLRLAALGGHKRSAVLLGDLYLEEKLNNEALKWYRLAADKGDSEGQYTLGMLYLKGIGVEKDEETSFYWFRKAASWHYPASKWGDEKAQYMVGLAYLEGRWPRKDPKAAIQWIEWSAGHGYVEAQALLGHLYATGKGAPIDREKAAEWLKLAADKGSEFAKEELIKLQNRSITDLIWDFLGWFVI